MRATPFVLVVAAVAATGLAPAAGAHTVRAPAARHCVVWIAPTSGRAPSKVSKLRCYTRFSHALRVARGPAPHGFSGATTGVVPHASTLISTDFDNANMAGTSLTWTVSNREDGTAIDLWLFSTNPNLMDQYSQDELDQLFLNSNLNARPTLSATQAGKTVVVSWPASASGFLLESTSTLSTPNWTAAADTVSVVGDRNTITINAAAATGSKFYRLRKP